MIGTSNQWYTPAVLHERVRAFFVPAALDLDPCTTAEANTRVTKFAQSVLRGGRRAGEECVGPENAAHCPN
ncbi:hypothetical protein TSOC_005327 [Tetrabaena socialis]|uniref:Uncharacterized protein n=1 Tax=Tetrabaena socialis TaxID=47790 RepID=A0A2J8A6L1_9CHLO|nr:hypothetical protein TSOC_005327 [Tetrabaena socialis]|eukprot:PNH08171.1 hypothetical protein TSOC_005327 [Tetrabaena socialis]